MLNVCSILFCVFLIALFLFLHHVCHGALYLDPVSFVYNISSLNIYSILYCHAANRWTWPTRDHSLLLQMFQQQTQWQTTGRQPNSLCFPLAFSKSLPMCKQPSTIWMPSQTFEWFHCVVVDFLHKEHYFRLFLTHFYSFDIFLGLFLVVQSTNLRSQQIISSL